MTKAPKSKKLKDVAFKWVIAKGLGVTVLIIFNIVSLYAINLLWKAYEKLSAEVSSLKTEVLRDNTRTFDRFEFKLDQLLKTQPQKPITTYYERSLPSPYRPFNTRPIHYGHVFCPIGVSDIQIRHRKKKKQKQPKNTLELGLELLVEGQHNRVSGSRG